MTIEKSGKVYKVKENVGSWTLSAKIGSVEIAYNVPKADCPTFDDLKAYVAENKIF